MERERLTRLLEEPGRMALEDLRDLKGMAEQFPWFSGARLLQAVGERQSGQVRSDETLRAAAAHLPSRAALYDLSMDPAPAKPSPLRVVRNEVVAAEPQLRAIPLAVEQAAEQITAIDTPTAPAPVELEPRLNALQAAPTLAEAPTGESPTVETTAPAADELNDQILEAALTSAYDLTWQEQVANPSRTAVPPVPASQPSSQAPESAPRRVPKDARLRFTDWLDSTGAPTPAIAPPEAVAIPAAAPAPPVQHFDPETLIDRFIRQDTPDIPPKPAFFTPQQAGRKSLDDTTGLVTETLARIYEQQGNTAKAIETYRRLALKYPAKSAYFAALSKALEDKSTS
ncbi:MAG: hypothetical protein IPM46_07260 [Flavobacteriales bacterium]|nr:hypothetical protein [Flavobacteriales bacterium]